MRPQRITIRINNFRAVKWPKFDKITPNFDIGEVLPRSIYMPNMIKIFEKNATYRGRNINFKFFPHKIAKIGQNYTKL